ncbi:polyhydroxyalkanoate synthase [Faunimonas pinastri]|uniref:Polyhydroxyalkanoate synthase n=1 Tax=Faunimonas pinastri TaxID=1855383 RepID=A0A1H9C9W1_9HYPH|nr:class I poly(R)-hydroxyalkanoic acid synthase [Faunimonas pinastri]SEP97919.1 polyhydroxyalkanoate synthase [Faunimonas pinastri]
MTRKPRSDTAPSRPDQASAASPDGRADPDLLARNLSAAMEVGMRVFSALLSRSGPDGDQPGAMSSHLGVALRALSPVIGYWTANPERQSVAQARLLAQFAAIFTTAALKARGETPEGTMQPGARDRRFSAPEWTENPLLDSLKQVYLAGGRWARQLVDETEGLDEDERLKARFFLTQIVSAMAPTNFPALNPEVLQEAKASDGESLLRGMRFLDEDVQAPGGGIRLRQSDPRPFELGRDLASTPGKVVAQNDLCQIIQYAPATGKVLKRPLLIVPPWINKFYVLDLGPDKSFIRWAVEQGHTVFLISWVNPDERHATKDFAAYVREGIFAALDVVEAITGERQTNVIGYCIGGTLLAMALARLAALGEDRIATATMMTAQVDFRNAGDLRVFVDEEQIAALEKDMAATGFLPGAQMANVFNMLRPDDLIWPYVIDTYYKGKEPRPFDILHWNADSTRLPAANHSFYLRNCYLENNLARGLMEIEGEKVELGRVRVPLYHLAAEGDHISPARSIFAGARLFGGPARFVLAGSGHIAGVINPPSRGKYHFRAGETDAATLEEWQAKAELRPGSWWPDWHDWVSRADDRKVGARQPGSRDFPPIEDAPGSYVRVSG